MKRSGTALRQGTSKYPPGLEYLADVDLVLVHQKVELLEVLSGFETKNMYFIKNKLGQQIYCAREESNCCARNMCRSARPFRMIIYDNYGNQGIHMRRPLACQSCCFPCCLQSIEVSAPPGVVIGRVKQKWNICFPKFTIKDTSGKTIFFIKGPCCTSRLCGNVVFYVMLTDRKTKVGKISKQWAGLIQEMYTDADNFGITFPANLDVTMKAVLLGACLLIDFMYFEDNTAR